MPIYEYKCLQCGLHVEKRQSVSDPPLTSCEKCHGQLEKQWSLSGFQFKGAGWYVTDYAGKKGVDGAGKTEKTSAPESTASTDSASNSKSDATTSSTTDAVSKKD